MSNPLARSEAGLNTDSVGRAVVDLSGQEPGQASLLKMIGNVILMTTMETVAEIYVFAEKAGLGTQQMQKFMGTMFPNPPHSVYSAKMLGGDYCRKDVCILRLVGVSADANSLFVAGRSRGW